MDFTGTYTLPGPPDAVWAALHDPEILAACIPGCEGVERISETAYQAKALLKIGPVKARFQGKVTWEDIAPPVGNSHAGILRGEGQGGAAGFARGESHVLLRNEGAGTVLTYQAKASIGGRLAQIGQRLVDSAARSIADDFFGKFSQLMQAAGQPAMAEPHEHAKTVPETANTHPNMVGRGDDGLAPQIWVAGLIGIVIVLLVVFGLVL